MSQGDRPVPLAASRGVAVKICGITGLAGARAALDAGADYLGLVLAPSPRRVSFDVARELVRNVPARWVGVFVDPEPRAALEVAAGLDLAALQLHGSEPRELCAELRAAADRPVWKALGWTGDPGAVHRYAGSVDAVLLDVARGTGPAGGSGRPLPWSQIADLLPVSVRPVPIILAGGLDRTNVRRAIASVRPDGVDGSSRLESRVGEKEPERIRAFVVAAAAAAEAVRPGRSAFRAEAR